MTLEHHIQVHEDPLVLFLVPRAPHLLYSTAGFGAALVSEIRDSGPTWVRVRAHLDGDDMACLPEAHLPHLATGAAAHLPQVLQVVDFCLVALVRKAKAKGLPSFCPNRPSPIMSCPLSEGCEKGSTWPPMVR